MCAAAARTRAPFPGPPPAAMVPNGHAAGEPQQQQPRPAAGAEPGATWCRRAARAVRQRLGDASQLFREYQYVVALDDTIRHAQGDALRSDSAPRNRYANVLPYDYNRWGFRNVACEMTCVRL